MEAPLQPWKRADHERPQDWLCLVATELIDAIVDRNERLLRSDLFLPADHSRC